MYRGSFSYIVAATLIIVLITTYFYLTLLSMDSDKYGIVDDDVEKLMRFFVLLYCLEFNGDIERIGNYTIEKINSTVFVVIPESGMSVEYIIQLNSSSLDCEVLLN